jgi:large subunit ribosomal protein L32
MPVPKRRKSISRSRMQRAANMKYAKANYVSCNSCNEPKVPHSICQSCGKYKERQMIKVVEASGE